MNTSRYIALNNEVVSVIDHNAINPNDQNDIALRFVALCERNRIPIDRVNHFFLILHKSSLLNRHIVTHGTHSPVIRYRFGTEILTGEYFISHVVFRLPVYR